MEMFHHFLQLDVADDGIRVSVVRFGGQTRVAAEGESDEDCALREVHEETGLHCVLEDELPATHYVDAKGRPKRVRWWRMSVQADDGFTANEEVDELRWVDQVTAAGLLSYPRDVTLL